MRKTLLAFACIAFSISGFGQARLVLNNNAWLRIDNGAWVVLENPATNALTTSGTGGNIRSEGENNRIRWQIGNATGGYTLPWTNAAGTKIPLTYTITGAGSPATASVVFSTYAGSTWDNYTYRPSDVTHMNNYFTGFSNSQNVVDRFWVMDPSATGFAYVSKPAVSINFIYPQAEILPGNTITALTALGAQRFNNTSNWWGDFLPSGVFAANTPAAGVNTVSGATATGTQNYRSWTLSNLVQPLPIELTEFKGHCDADKVVIEWTTATEKDNDYFTIEKSRDAQDWRSIGVVDGAGNSQQAIQYLFVDEEPTTIAYYRLRQTDFDGTYTYSNTIVAGCEVLGGTEIVNAWDDGQDVNVVVSSSLEVVHDLYLIDAQGKNMLTAPRQSIMNGITHLRIAKGTIAAGVYVVRLQNDNAVLTHKLLVN